jgi:hypothetical protein
MGRSMEHAVCGKCGWNMPCWGSVDDSPCPKCRTRVIVWSCPESPCGPEGCSCVAVTLAIYAEAPAEYDMRARGKDGDP